MKALEYLLLLGLISGIKVHYDCTSGMDNETSEALLDMEIGTEDQVNIDEF